MGRTDKPCILPIRTSIADKDRAEAYRAKGYGAFMVYPLVACSSSSLWPQNIPGGKKDNVMDGHLIIELSYHCTVQYRKL